MQINIIYHMTLYNPEKLTGHILFIYWSSTHIEDDIEFISY